MEPAVKVVDLRHVSEEDVPLAVEDGRQEPDQSWVVHLCPVSLQRGQLTVNASTIPMNLRYKQQEGPFYSPSPEEPRAARPHISVLCLGVPSSRD